MLSWLVAFTSPHACLVPFMFSWLLHFSSSLRPLCHQKSCLISSCLAIGSSALYWTNHSDVSSLHVKEHSTRVALWWAHWYHKCSMGGVERDKFFSSFVTDFILFWARVTLCGLGQPWTQDPHISAFKYCIADTLNVKAKLQVKLKWILKNSKFQPE